MKKKLIAGCIALAAGIGSGQASAATYGVTADTSVYEYLGNMNSFGFTDLFIFSTNPSASGGASAHSFVSVLAFESLNSSLSSLTAGTYSATLNLYAGCAVGGWVSGCTSSTLPITVDVLTAASNWTETGAISFASLFGGDTYASFTVDSNGWISIDITDLVAYWATLGTTGNGILLSAQAYGSVRGASGNAINVVLGGDEGAFASYIDIQATNVIGETPIPGALPLFATGLGAIGLMVHRRKRKQAA